MSVELPPTWARVRLGDLLAEPLRNGRSVPDSPSGFPVLRLTALRGTGFSLEEYKIGAWSRAEAEPYIVESGDFFVARGNGSLDLVGRGGVVREVSREVAFPDTMIRIRVRPELVRVEYLRYLWDSRLVREQIERKARTTAGIYKINQGHLLDLNLPLPPLAEQERLVDALATQLSCLESGLGNLTRAQANLKRYHASLRKAACQGRLVPTEAELARDQGGEYETADALLDRTLKERRDRWQERELAKLRARGKPSKDGRWKRRYQEPTGPDTEALPQLPDGWAWATVDQLAAIEDYSLTDGPFGSNLKTAHYTEDGPRVLRLQNIGDGVFVDERAHISASHFHSLAKHRVYGGDVVIASLGAELPRACVVPDSVGPAIVKADCIRFKPAPGVLLPQYANVVLNAEPTRQRMGTAIHGMGRPRLGLRMIRSIAIPLPPFAEQVRIVEEMERLSSIREQTEATLRQLGTRAERLRQSILTHAFEGRLVPEPSRG